MFTSAKGWFGGSAIFKSDSLAGAAGWMRKLLWKMDVGSDLELLSGLSERAASSLRQCVLKLVTWSIQRIPVLIGSLLSSPLWSPLSLLSLSFLVKQKQGELHRFFWYEASWLF